MSKPKTKPKATRAKRKTPSKPRAAVTKSTPATVLVLRTCKANMRSPSSDANGFTWPTSGPVEAPDWNPEAICGYGLHGLLWGEGDGSTMCWDEDAKWIVVEVTALDIVDLKGKVKFPRGVVVCCGTALEATNYIAKRAPGRAIVRGTATAGVRGTATAGDWGTATAGDWGTATAGDGGTATAGDNRGTATAGYRGTATAGDRGTATAGDWGTATAGDEGTATAGDRGTATAGDGGTATAGDGGTATAGDRGTATAGDGGTATAGYGGEIRIRWYDEATDRYRCAVGYVGEDGVTAGIAYVVREKKLVPAKGGVK